ncbi:MAG TPA: YbjQ family protein [Flavipsychrobacter sp.]|nr:YbjQ family protein [Flavipsychrobacter sp.]
MRSLIITTTNSLEGYTIVKYFNPVSSNVVIGTNIFSDLAASFTDFFGGRSGVYEKKLQQLYKLATDKLAKDAEMIGANAVVGLKIDMDEVNGKGSQMFMVTAYGTPVKLKADDNNTSVFAEKVYDGYYISNKIQAKKILAIPQGAFQRFSKANIDVMLETKFTEFVNYALDGIKHYTDINNRTEKGFAESDALLAQFKSYFGYIDADTAQDVLYGTMQTANTEDYFKVIMDIIADYSLLNYDKIKELIEREDISEAKFGLRLMTANKSYYTDNDLQTMEQIMALIPQRFKPTGEVSMKKKLLSSSEKEVWTCKCGKVNDMDAKYCGSCHNDIYGFQENEIKPADVVSMIGLRLEIAKEIAGA